MESESPLKLHEGIAFGSVGWGQIQSYCGLFTPQFYTKKMGIRNLTIGSTDPEFHPWRTEWVSPHLERVRQSNLPETFEEFRARLDLVNATSSGRVRFQPEATQFGQRCGVILVDGRRWHSGTVFTLAMGIPILQKLIDRGLASSADAIFATKSMVAAGIAEDISDGYDRRYRWHGYARFGWEAYFIDEFLKRV